MAVSDAPTRARARASISARAASGSRSPTRPAPSRSPHAVLLRGGDHDADHRAIVAAAREADATTIVVGLAAVAVGRDGPGRAGRARRDRRAARRRGGPTSRSSVHDERLTTVTAERSARRGADEAATPRRQVVDKVAAAVMLQSWLETRERQ